MVEAGAAAMNERHVDKPEARSIGLALLVLRRASGMTPDEVSAASGVTRSNISRFETGKTMPRYDTMRRLVKAMRFPLSALHEAQRVVDGLMGRDTGEDDAGGDGTLPPDVRTEAREPALSRQEAVRLAQEVGKAFAHVTLAFLEVKAGGWGEGRRGE
jgi:transcriptional regulator with XRE-family HTH domain